MFSDRPNITQAQLAAPISALVAVLAVIYQAPERLQLPLLIVIGVLAAVWILSDALLRGKRNEHAAAQVNQATAQLLTLPPEGNDAIVPAGPTTAARLDPPQNPPTSV